MTSNLAVRGHDCANRVCLLGGRAFEDWSEGDLGPQGDGIELRADITLTALESGVGGTLHGTSHTRAAIDQRQRTRWLVDDAVHVIEHEPDVAVGIPVEPRGVDGLFATGGTVHEAQAIVEIDHAVAPRDFKGAPVAALPREWAGRYRAGIGGSRRVVAVRLAGQGPACLDVAAVEVEGRPGTVASAALGPEAPVDGIPEVLP